MFLFDWFMSALTFLGLANKRAKLVFLGLDNAGKTTLLRMLKDDRVAQHVPTLHPSSEELTMQGVTFTTYDLGGHAQARRVWKTYFPAVDGIVFVVDASEQTRFEEAKAELHGILLEQQVNHCPVLILGNKIDCPNAVSQTSLCAALGIDSLLSGKTVSVKDLGGRRPMEIYMCSIIKKQGYGEGFRWLAGHL